MLALRESMVHIVASIFLCWSMFFFCVFFLNAYYGWELFFPFAFGALMKYGPQFMIYLLCYYSCRGATERRICFCCSCFIDMCVCIFSLVKTLIENCFFLWKETTWWKTGKQKVVQTSKSEKKEHRSNAAASAAPSTCYAMCIWKK